MDELPELKECSKKAYDAWKAELATKGKTPTDAVAYCRSIGMTAYADTLEGVIAEYETAPVAGAEDKEAYLAERRAKRRRIKSNL